MSASLRDRLNLVTWMLATSVGEGAPAFEAFKVFWSTILHDFDILVQDGGADEELTRQVHRSIRTVEIFAKVISGLNAPSDAMHREIPRDVDATFAYLQNNDGEEYDSHHHSGHDGCSQGPHIDIDEAVRNAVKHGSGESSLFESALGYLSDKKHKHEPLDKEHVTNAFEQAYSQGAAGNLSANSMGSAAALNVLKQITSGGQSSGSGFGSLTQLISLAMAEATKLFDKSGRATSGDKQDAVNGAAMTMMKIFFSPNSAKPSGREFGKSGRPDESRLKVCLASSISWSKRSRGQ